jgi:hypothetical protein
VRGSPASLRTGASGSHVNLSAPPIVEGEFHLGSAQVAVLWRLTKGNVASRAIVMDDANGMRLVVVEAERIVRWERFQLPSELRARALTIEAAMRRNGWTRSQ